MASLRLRWSEQEARKPYSRPIMVSFVDDDGGALGSIAVSGADLLYWRQFGVAVAALAGELFVLDSVVTAPDPQLAWLETLAGLLPRAEVAAIVPGSSFDHATGREFGFEVAVAGGGARVGAAVLLEYQELQAALAHQCGRLLRVPEVERIADPAPRQRAWLAWLAAHVERPGSDEALAPSWPWR